MRTPDPGRACANAAMRRVTAVKAATWLCAMLKHAADVLLLALASAQKAAAMLERTRVVEGLLSLGV